MHKLPSTLLVKPAGPDCNLSCGYCFYLKKSYLFPGTAAHRMSDAVLEETVRQAMDQGGDTFHFTWQGGEPTLMGLDFFRRAVEFQTRCGRPGQVVGNGLQTNGVLIDGAWPEFLRDSGFLVGLSLDGPEEVHDRHRSTASGRGSWRQTVRARDILLEAGVEVNAVSVITGESSRRGGEIYEYHKSGGLIHMQFIPCVEPDPLLPSVLSRESVTAEAYGRFLFDIFDLWTGDFRNGEPKTFVRFFDNLFYSYVGLRPPDCSMQAECGTYLVVEHNGDVFPCDFFVNTASRLGNVSTHRLSDLLNSEAMARIGTVKSALPRECGECAWLAHCHAGCPKDRRALGNPSGPNPLCGAFRMFFNHADPFLRTLAEDWMRNRAAEAAKEPRPVPGERPGRNDPCPCGSGRKVTKCCGADKNKRPHTP